MSFINKIVVITAATSGIGQAVALHFAKLSARLYLFDTDVDSLKKTVEKCEKLSRTKVYYTVADLTEDVRVKEVVDNVKKQFGRIDVVINCVDIFKPSKILDTNVMSVYDELMTSNFRCAVRITNCVSSLLAESHGSLIFISSVSATLTTSETFVYNVSKACLSHFSKCVALELAAKGVRVNCVIPGAMSTNIMLTTEKSREECDVFYKKSETKLPLKHNVKVDDISELVAYLASDKAKSMTGSNYTVDSGLSLFGCHDILTKTNNVM